MSQDNGLVKRGLVLLALMSALVLVVLSVMLQRSTPALPAAAPRPELLAAALVRPAGAFPGAVAWHEIYQIGAAFPSGAGWSIRYNAAAALARRGSPEVPWDVILEMLDEGRQMQNRRLPRPDGTTLPDESAVRRNIVATLRAIAKWHYEQGKTRPEMTSGLTRVYAAVDQLAAHPVMEIKMQAENTRQMFFR